MRAVRPFDLGGQGEGRDRCGEWAAAYRRQVIVKAAIYRCLFGSGEVVAGEVDLGLLLDEGTIRTANIGGVGRKRGARHGERRIDNRAVAVDRNRGCGAVDG